MKLHSKNVVLGPEVDLRKIAGRTPDFVGADLANLINEAAQIDEEVARFVEEAHQKVLKILSGRRNVLDDLAHLLSQQENVQGDELRMMLSKSTAAEMAD